MSNLKSNTEALLSLIEQANTLPEEKTIQSSKTVTPTTSSQTVKPDSGYDGMGQVVVNAMPTATQATPSVSIDSAGKITAAATQSAGYVAAGTKTGTKQLTTQAAKTITPTKSSQTAVAKNVYTTGAVTVAAIPSQYQDVSGVTLPAELALEDYTYIDANGNTVAGTMKNWAKEATPSGTFEIGPNPYDKDNIVVNVYAPDGYHDGRLTKSINLSNHTITPTESTQTLDALDSGNPIGKVTINPIPSQYITTTDASAAADDIVSGETAYVNGVKLTGTNPYEKSATNAEVEAQTTLLEQAIAALNSKASSAEPLLQGKVVTPSAITQIVYPSDSYDGLSHVTVNGDANLIAENIAEGIEVFGVTGTHIGGLKVETATVRISGDISTYRPRFVSYTTVIDGTVAGQVISENTADAVTLENVLIGSTVTVFWNQTTANSMSGCIRLEGSLDSFYVYQITAANAYTTMSSNGGGSND